jgi:hypothetical protein
VEVANLGRLRPLHLALRSPDEVRIVVGEKPSKIGDLVVLARPDPPEFPNEFLLVVAGPGRRLRDREDQPARPADLGRVEAVGVLVPVGLSGERLEDVSRRSFANREEDVGSDRPEFGVEERLERGVRRVVRLVVLGNAQVQVREVRPAGWE